MKIRTQTLASLKSSGQKFAALTSYDYQTSSIFDAAGIEVILVGDSAANTVLGSESTLSITVDQMITFGQAVVKGARSALVVVDLPFGSYEASTELAIQSATRIMKETGAAAVKLEGGENRAAQIRAIVAAGIPVMGHVGFTPQTVHSLGGYKVQGRGEKADQVLKDVQAVSEAGAFAVVLEMVPAELAKTITETNDIVTIGIGAGNGTDGQILVWQDFAGLAEKSPSFSKQYLTMRDQLANAAGLYRDEVRNGSFPDEGHSFN